MSVELKGLSKSFGNVKAVDNLSLLVETGSFAAILGPSGCGKTTTLRLLAGFELPSAGDILINDRDVKHLPPRKRNFGIVFQNYALFPHMTVFQNVAYGLRMQKIGREDIVRRVGEALELVHLTGLDERKPRELSGGQQQRVALARSIVLEPELLLFDEPLSNLDAKLRHSMRVEIRRIQQRLGITTIFVTHDQEEALSMADLVVVMNQGLVEQVGTPAEVYRKPRTRFVAEFIGGINWIPAHVTRVSQEGLFAMTQDQRLLRTTQAAEGSFDAGDPVTLLVRPEEIRLVADRGGESEPSENCLRGTVSDVVFLGAALEYHVTVAGSQPLNLVCRVYGLPEQGHSVGTRVLASWRPAACAFYGSGVM